MVFQFGVYADLLGIGPEFPLQGPTLLARIHPGIMVGVLLRTEFSTAFCKLSYPEISLDGEAADLVQIREAKYVGFSAFRQENALYFSDVIGGTR